MKPHIAEWEHKENIIGLGAYYECSNCGGTSLYAKSQEKYAFMSFPSRFCPHCGYRMKIRENLK